ncbi:replication protein A 70 kDa DNA-binding subunit A-like [Bidens hawaiensis]|uniref:replication protein A 70 kDa DNA-binding subunit A-like n=1 Tax=Bidens hawaiensis TaxID=980011 RepID=UPI00404AD0C1
MSVKLTEGAIALISNGEWNDTYGTPVVQVMNLRTTPNHRDRYRASLSDGVFFQNAMLGTQLNHLVTSQHLQNGSLVQLNQYNVTSIKDRLIIIVLSLDVIRPFCDVIGDAKPFSSAPGGEPSTLRPAAPMQSINQPPTSIHSPHNNNFTGSVQQPNFAVNPPNYPPNYGVNSPNYGVSRPPANSYMRPVQPTYNQPPSMYTNRGPTAKNVAPPRIIPIAGLNPYQGMWTIKARVTAKGELRHFNNAKGDGKVFSFDLLDADGDEIRTTCFNAVADQFYNQIEVGKVYFISKGNVKPAQKAYNHLKNEQEITLDYSSTIQPCLEDDRSIPQQQFHFRPIAEIENLDNNTIIDIIGVVYSIKPSSSIMKKDNTETLKQTLCLKDKSGRSVEVTLWGNFCNKEGQTLQNMCDSGTFPVLAIKAARVGEFNGKNVGTISTSQLFIEPDFPEGRELKTWYDNVGKNTPSISLSSDTIARTDVRKTISQIKDEKLGTIEKPDWITVSATLSHIKPETFCYTACPIMLGDRKCSKKVRENSDAKWQCDRCDMAVDQCDYRYILQMQLEDHTGITWATAFQETGEEIIGISAKELHCIRNEEQDEERFTEFLRSALRNKYNFKLKVKEETYNDEQRVKSTVVNVEKIKFSSDTSFLLDLLKKENPKIEIPAGASVPSNSFMGSVVGQQARLPISQTGQYGNQYGGYGHGVTCNSCGGVGHSSMNCPSAVDSSGGRFNSMASAGGNSSNCYKCHQPGHWAKDCPGVNNVSAGYGGGNVGPGRYGGASGQYVGGY